MRHNQQIITVPSIGGSFTVDVAASQEIVNITSSAAITLSSAATISATGTAVKGTIIEFHHDGDFTTDTATGKHLSVFGFIVPDEIALYEAIITARYDGSAWKVHVCPSIEGNQNVDGATIEDGSIPTAALADNAISNAKLATATRGTIKGVTTADGTVTDIDVSGDGKLLIGDGTDLNSVSVTGDVTIDNAGVTTIGASKVTTDMLNFTLASYLETTVTITSAQILDMYVGAGGTAVEVIAAPGTGKAIEVLSATAKLDYNTTTYTGGGAVNLTYEAGGTSTANISSATITSNTDAYEKFGGSPPSLTTFINQALFVENATASFATGDSPLILNIAYRIIDFT